MFIWIEPIIFKFSEQWNKIKFIINIIIKSIIYWFKWKLNRKYVDY